MSDYLEHMKERESQNGDTLTIWDLIQVLSKYPPGAKVFITWESTVNAIREEDIYETHTGNIYLDGESGYYKDNFSK